MRCGFKNLCNFFHYLDLFPKGCFYQTEKAMAKTTKSFGQRSSKYLHKLNKFYEQKKAAFEAAF